MANKAARNTGRARPAGKAVRRRSAGPTRGGVETVRMEFLTSPQVARYLKKNDLAILPVGCFEMHGPHVPLGCDTLHAHAMAVILGELWGCLVLPPIMYSYPGASGPWPGTMSPRPTATIAYVKEMCLAAIAAGFKRLVVLATHGPMSFVMQTVIREIHQETGQIILHIAPMNMMPKDLMEKRLGYGRGEDILVLAAAKVLGLPEGLVPKMDWDSPDRCFPFASMSGLRRAECQMPWTFSEPWQHQPVRSKVQPADGDKAVEVMREAARRNYADVPRLFSQYQRDMAKREKNPPWDMDKVAKM
ncbi:MAG TPA: creatininase family protein [Phycisphaerae bacterium]|nr:creatininase family protein [Phycisphaerae bacterium]